MTDTLHARVGTFADEIGLRHRLAGLVPAPALVLCEPRAELPPGGGRGRLPGFNALTRGVPDLSGIPVADILASWPDACLRIVVAEDRIRWAALATTPDALPLAGESDEAPAFTDLDDRRRPILFRAGQDLHRFRIAGGSDGPGPFDGRDIEVREFHQGGHVVAWWLIENVREEQLA